jgi:hypothetical protein
VEIIEALFLTYSQFYIFNIEYYQDNIASWQFIQHVIAENKGGKVLKKVITLTQIQQQHKRFLHHVWFYQKAQ